MTTGWAGAPFPNLFVKRGLASKTSHKNVDVVDGAGDNLT